MAKAYRPMIGRASGLSTSDLPSKFGPSRQTRRTTERRRDVLRLFLEALEDRTLLSAGISGSGANLVVLGAGESFTGTLDDQAATRVTLRGSRSGAFQPDQLLTSSYAHVYDANPNGTWGLVFIGDVSGLTLRNWSLDFTVAE